MARDPRADQASLRQASSRAIALESMIQGSLDTLRNSLRPASPAEALLFVGNWNDALPRLLIHDQVLEPVDKIVWAVIRTQADPQRGTAFPSYATIGRLANVGSDATVSRAVAILRVTRWLTLCARARDGWGRFRGSVYALHDEPLSLADTLYLDQGYMDFAYQAVGHHHARVARVASSVVRSLELDLIDGIDPSAPADAAAERFAAQQTNSQGRQDEAKPDRPMQRPASVYGVRSSLRLQLRQHLVATEDGGRLQNLKAAVSQDQDQFLKAADHLQILKAVQPQNFSPHILRPQISRDAVVVSSNDNTTTTTAASDIPLQDKLGGSSSVETPLSGIGVLRWPTRLSSNYRHLAAIQLRTVPIDLRQAVLDILERRLLSVDGGAEPLRYGPLAYLKTLCVRAVSGQLVLPSAEPARPTAPSCTQAPDLARLRANLRVARADHAHWLRLKGLHADPERQAPILALLDQTASTVAELEAALAAAARGQS